MRVAVVIPSFKVRRHILDVVSKIGAEVSAIYVVDDKCPENTGEFVLANCRDKRVTVLFHELNQGVGGAVITGYQRAAADGADVIVKIDGDGQMDPDLISSFVFPIKYGLADYAKGNRFYDVESVRSMPLVRLLGNAGLSFLTKLSSGYWDIFDPTNGYTAIHVSLLRSLHLEKIAKRYFFESDMLFRLNLMRAVVVDVPMMSVYGDEKSNLSIGKSLYEFAIRNLRNFAKRIFYNHFLRNFSVASMELMLGLGLLTFGFSFGLFHWWRSWVAGTSTPVGTVMLASLPIIIGTQFLLNFLNFDIASIPRRPLSASLPIVREAVLERNSVSQECLF